MAFDARREADGLEARLAEVGTSERAEHEKRYLKSELEHLGATVWQIRREVRAFTEENPGLTHAQVVRLVGELWSKPVHERRMAATMVLEDYPALLGPSDLPLLERLIRESSTWALVDGLAADVLGELLVRHPSAAAQLDSWAEDPDFWLRRSSLLAQIKPMKEGAPFERVGRYADLMLEEREFFIRKAIGWLIPRAGRASGVTMREAVKYLKPEQRSVLMP